MGLFSRFKKSSEGETKKRSAVLTVASNQKVSASASMIAFTIPESLQQEFDFEPGQYINLHCPVGNETLIRSYSICSGKNDGLAVGVKAIEGGKASNWLVHTLMAGDSIEVDFPQGNFKVPAGSKNLVAFAAGSGITPIFSIAKSLSPDQQLTLFYGNTNPEEAMFVQELQARPQVNVHLYYSRTDVAGTQKGRLDKQAISEEIKAELSLLRADHFFICGPEAMIMGAQEVLTVFGIQKERIHFELFTAPVLMKQEETTVAGAFEGVSKVSAVLDNQIVQIELPTNGKSILDALDAAGQDVPYSCKGGVCCTCKAKIIEGSARMTINYALTDDEVKEGYILTCQAHPTSEVLKLDFDV